MSRLTLALDVMGGDIGPRITIPASIIALEQDPMLDLILFGDGQQISPLLQAIPPALKQRLTVQHCHRQINNEQGLSYALRHSKGTSMRLAIEAVQQGAAKACVSAGNTAALMALSKLLLQPLTGINRPALVAMLPTINGKHTLMLDLGANIECDAQNLYQFALMGSILAEQTLGIVYPRIALLNIGIEEIKGYKSIREAGLLIEKDPLLNYIGYLEGDLLLNHRADVIVSDGFVGNVALKTLEGAATNILALFKQQNSHKLWSYKKACSWLVKTIFKRNYQHLANFNPEQYNGASLIGLNSVVVKAHGSSSINGFAYAIKDAALQARQDIPTKILAGLERI